MTDVLVTLFWVVSGFLFYGAGLILVTWLLAYLANRKH